MFTPSIFIMVEARVNLGIAGNQTSTFMNAINKRRIRGGNAAESLLVSQRTFTELRFEAQKKLFFPTEVPRFSHRAFDM